MLKYEVVLYWTFFLTILFRTSQMFSFLFSMSISFPQFFHCFVLLTCGPEESVSVLLDLLFQFITQPPFTMTHASFQSLWPVWEPATAVQSFTYWTMVRGRTNFSLLMDVCLWFPTVLQWFKKNNNRWIGKLWCLGQVIGLMLHLHATSASALWATLMVKDQACSHT